MPNIFSFPAFPPSANDYTVDYYQVTKSAASENDINPYGPWTNVGSTITNNLDFIDAAGSTWDLYRVTPTITMLSTNTQLTLNPSRPFRATDPLYDCQISALIQTYRQSFLNDIGIAATDSTIPTESTGQGAAPFITDTDISRFYLSFIPNTDPVKFRESEVVVYLGTSGTPPGTTLVPYTDYYPSGSGGYIDFAVNPGPTDYLRVQYKVYKFTDDEIRNMLINAVSGLSLYGITDQTYDVQQSWNYYYLTAPLPSRDVGKIICSIAAKEFMGAQTLTMAQSAEQWKIGNTSYVSDPSRSIQGAIQYQGMLDQQIKSLAANYIINTRNYFSRGEYDSFFDNSGTLYPPFSVYNVFNYMSWWI